MVRSPDSSRLRVAELAKGRSEQFEIVPDAEALEALARDLGVTALRKVRFAGALEPAGRADWRLEGRLGATVVQPCVVTLAPVTTRIEETVERLFLADPPPLPEGEVEMPEDDSTEALPDVIDLGAILAEALALALPVYPRAEGVGPGDAQFTEPGVTPMSDEDAKPFAGLAGLRDKLGGKDET